MTQNPKTLAKTPRLYEPKPQNPPKKKTGDSIKTLKPLNPGLSPILEAFQFRLFGFSGWFGPCSRGDVGIEADGLGFRGFGFRGSGV